MLFNSLEFLLLFMPMVMLGVIYFHGSKLTFWISLISTLFYAYAGHAWFLIPMMISATLDFWIGGKIEGAQNQKTKKMYLIVSLTANLGLLAYFKYSGLFLDSLQSIFSLGQTDLQQDVLLPSLRVILPAGISFYTFQTLSYTIDIYRGHGKQENDYFTYYSFVSFFPHLVAGPLTRHNQLIPQIKNIAKFGVRPRWREGLFIFVAGLAKKVLIADRIGNLIDPMIENIGATGAVGAWLAMFGYSLQIYFDFSGYTDMAIGLGRLMQIELPQNFNSPYKATSPSDFWKRWHITLSLWLRDYLYIPLGGNRCSSRRQNFNLMLTMILGGFWHGASWNFMIWGVYHGFLLLVYHRFQKKWDHLPHKAQQGLMYLLVCFGWVFFRSTNLYTLVEWFKSLFFAYGFFGGDVFSMVPLVLLVFVGTVICYVGKNTIEIQWKELSPKTCGVLGFVACVCVLLMNYSSKFLYFQF